MPIKVGCLQKWLCIGTKAAGNHRAAGFQVYYNLIINTSIVTNEKVGSLSLNSNKIVMKYENLLLEAHQTNERINEVSTKKKY